MYHKALALVASLLLACGCATGRIDRSDDEYQAFAETAGYPPQPVDSPAAK